MVRPAALLFMSCLAGGVAIAWLIAWVAAAGPVDAAAPSREFRGVLDGERWTGSTRKWLGNAYAAAFCVERPIKRDSPPSKAWETPLEGWMVRGLRAAHPSASLVVVRASGWPWVGLVQVTTARGPTVPQPEGGIALPGTTRRFPVLVIWPGFLGSAAVYTGAVAAGLGGVGLMRRAIRRRRGQCVRCGYALAGLAGGVACPECGSVPRG